MAIKLATWGSIETRIKKLLLNVLLTDATVEKILERVKEKIDMELMNEEQKEELAKILWDATVLTICEAIGIEAPTEDEQDSKG